MVSLPTSLAADILRTWLNVRDTVKLDSAYCNASAREDFLDLIRSPEFSIPSWVFDPGYKKTTDNIVGWANIRNVAVEKIAMGRGDLKVYDAFLTKRGRGVLIIKAKGVVFTKKMMKSISKCSNLTMLDLYDCEIPSSLRDVFVECKSLREFRCDFRHDRKTKPKKQNKGSLKDTDLDGLNCPSIKAMRIDTCSDFHLVGALLKLAPEVEMVHLSSVDTESIDFHFDYINSHLTTLSIPEVDLSPEALYELIEHFPVIEHLNLDGNDPTALMVEEIGDNLPLKSINLSSADIEDGVLAPLAKCLGDKLDELILCQCYNLTLAAVQEVLPLFTKLTSFSMHYAEIDVDVMDLSLLSRFTTLTLIYEGDEGAEFVSELARHCAKLEHLHIQLFDQYFLAEDMDHLISTCTNLRTLTLLGEMEPYHCKDDVARWQASRPGLVVSSDFVVELSVMRDAL